MQLHVASFLSRLLDCDFWQPVSFVGITIGLCPSCSLGTMWFSSGWGVGLKRPMCDIEYLFQLKPKEKSSWNCISTKAANVGPIVCCCGIAMPLLFCNLHKVCVNLSLLSRDILSWRTYGTLISQKEQTFRAPLGYIAFKVIAFCSRLQLGCDRDRLTRATLVCEITLRLDR